MVKFQILISRLDKNNEDRNEEFESYQLVRVGENEVEFVTSFTYRTLSDKGVRQIGEYMKSFMREENQEKEIKMQDVQIHNGKRYNFLRKVLEDNPPLKNSEKIKILEEIFK